MLIAPPATPRPAKVEPGPRRISTCSVKKFSRTLTPGIAHAVDEDVVAGIEAANEEAVTEGIAALTRSERHAGRAQDRLLQRRGVLVLEHFLGEHGDRFRRVEDWLREFTRRLHSGGHVGRGGICVRITIGRTRARIGDRRLCGLLPLRRAPQRVARADLIGGGLRSDRTRTREAHRRSPAADSSAAPVRRSRPSRPRSDRRPWTQSCRSQRRNCCRRISDPRPNATIAVSSSCPSHAPQCLCFHWSRCDNATHWCYRACSWGSTRSLQHSV